MTSDDTVGNLPYGATKGALDRVVLAAAKELAHLHVTANVINPGATDTGWIPMISNAEFGTRRRSTDWASRATRPTSWRSCAHRRGVGQRTAAGEQRRVRLIDCELGAGARQA